MLLLTPFVHCIFQAVEVETRWDGRWCPKSLLFPCPWQAPSSTALPGVFSCLSVGEWFLGLEGHMALSSLGSLGLPQRSECRAWLLYLGAGETCSEPALLWAPKSAADALSLPFLTCVISECSRLWEPHLVWICARAPLNCRAGLLAIIGFGCNICSLNFILSQGFWD